MALRATYFLSVIYGDPVVGVPGFTLFHLVEEVHVFEGILPLTGMTIVQGYCSIKYSPVSDQFQLSGATSPALGYNGDACSLDYVVISNGAPSPGEDVTYDR